MPDSRKITFANGEIYHIFNRGVEKRPIFTDKREYNRALETLRYYLFANIPVRFSKYLQIKSEERTKLIHRLYMENKKIVDILAFSLLPNHFHLLLRQVEKGGITRFMTNFSNSYTKYFNAKNERVGPLLQGLFKAVHAETDEQFLHLTRYIHLNPVLSFIVDIERLADYPYSSFREYLNEGAHTLSSASVALGYFNSRDDYYSFVRDQVEYAKELEKIRYLTFED